jgi:hypothetical protein
MSIITLNGFIKYTKTLNRIKQSILSLKHANVTHVKTQERDKDNQNSFLTFYVLSSESFIT